MLLISGMLVLLMFLKFTFRVKCLVAGAALVVRHLYLPPILAFSRVLLQAGRLWASRYRASTLDQPDENRDDSQNEQNVNESAQGVGTDHSQQPEDQQNYSNGPEHRKPSFEEVCQNVQSGSSVGGPGHGSHPVESVKEVYRRRGADGGEKGIC